MYELQEIDRQFLENVRKLIEQSYISYQTFKLRKASQMIMELAQLGNAYFDSKKPWLEAKDQATRHSMETTISCCLECLKGLALISFPIIPETASKIWKLLGFQDELTQHKWADIVALPLPFGSFLPPPQILFKKIEDKDIQEELEKLQKMSKAAKSNRENAPAAKAQKEIGTLTQPPALAKEMVDISELKKIDLRIGAVTQAERIPKSKKLLYLQVDLGFEKRKIVAGVGHCCSPEELIGKRVVVVSNLKPTLFMGVESQGMVLAASNGDVLDPLTITRDDLPLGSLIS